MQNPDDFQLHMVSFKRKGDAAYNVAFGDGGNLKSWHLDVLEKWLAEQRARLAAGDDGSDLV